MEFLISIVVTLIVVGLLLWLINFLPLDGTIKQIIHAVVIVVVILYLIGLLLGYAHAPMLHFPRGR
jgi:hypothetical protein